MHSALYHGWLRHRRFAPCLNAFRYPLFLCYLDLAEMDHVFRGRWFWSAHRTALARFCRADHLGDPQVPLDQAVRDLVAGKTGHRPVGPIRLLTHLRYFGHGFNPVSFYYCFDADGTHIDCMVAEVNNTPWGEQHCYVLSDALSEVPSEVPTEAMSEPGQRVAGTYQRYTSDKAFHVSPFMPMELAYEWGFSTPHEKLYVHMALRKLSADTDSAKVFDATLQLTRAPITGAQLALALVRFPVMTLQVVAAIHWQGLKLWLKRVPVHTHPAKLKPAPAGALVKPQ